MKIVRKKVETGSFVCICHGCCFDDGGLCIHPDDDELDCIDVKNETEYIFVLEAEDD